MDGTKFEKLKTQAEQGGAKAQFQLGRYFHIGDGDSGGKDPAKAVEWFRKAAEQGHVQAQDSLAMCFYYGEGTPKDLSEARKWFEKAAEGGSNHAKIMLARFDERSKRIIDVIEKAVNKQSSADEKYKDQVINSVLMMLGRAEKNGNDYEVDIEGERRLSGVVDFDPDEEGSDNTDREWDDIECLAGDLVIDPDEKGIDNSGRETDRETTIGDIVIPEDSPHVPDSDLSLE